MVHPGRNKCVSRKTGVRSLDRKLPNLGRRYSTLGTILWATSRRRDGESETGRHGDARHGRSDAETRRHGDSETWRVPTVANEIFSDCPFHAPPHPRVSTSLCLRAAASLHLTSSGNFVWVKLSPSLKIRCGGRGAAETAELSSR